MKGLKKLTLATAIAAAPFAANAELKALDDTSMGNVTGQAGVTIELAAKVDIAEVTYQDEGYLAMSGVSVGAGDWAAGATASQQSALSDVKLYIDVVGGGGIGDTGALAIGSTYIAGAVAQYTAAGGTAAWSDTGNNDVTMPAVEDGDLVIGLRSISGDPVNYGIGIDSVKLASSDEGDTSTGGAGLGNLGGTTGTTLISDLKISGLLGPVDVVIQENSNEMNINAYFNASGTLKADFVGTYLDFELHNRRGADSNNLTKDGTIDTSYAHAQVDIGLGTPAALGAPAEALAFNVNNFSGDLDLTNIRMGDAANPSIGSLYMTDLKVNAQMTIYGH
ncbi:DUF6160 family protein [Marinobacter sp. chi1]|uniref:DUF6160 family protein n=1 Tax=Marinobacter suaedae TaxID=3057675 RepID=A0ABT8W292_9GAMM|nr:DUF6160 family protein [Marinobacter sp. chi1]MDO3722352.1 DUF6160 family protein [Marinobacter sp. chi1]